MLPKMLHPFETFQIGIGLTLMNTIMPGKLTNESHNKTQCISIFLCHIYFG